MKEEITYLTDVALITCIVPSGDADDIVKAAREAGATAALVYHGRGFGIRERLGLLGIAVDAEKDVVSLLVSSDQRNIVADGIYHAGHFGTPTGGFLYITLLEKAATYIPQNVKEQLRKKAQGQERL